MSRPSFRALLVSLLLGSLRWAGTCTAEPDLIDIQAVDPTIVVELRYATTRNIARRPLYPPNMPALVRAPIAAKLAQAQTILRPHGFRLKIWDAYRPKSAHEQLWQFSPNVDYVADPADGGSLHTWGVAVDATLVTQKGRDVPMPTDFDDFTPAAMLRYAGANQSVRRNLRLLQSAMARAGFYGLRTEWWHFVAKDWKNYRAASDWPVPPPAVPETPPLRAMAVASPSRSGTH